MFHNSLLTISAFGIGVSECNTAPGMPESTLDLPHKLARVLAVQEEMLAVAVELDNLAGTPLPRLTGQPLQVWFVRGGFL